MSSIPSNQLAADQAVVCQFLDRTVAPEQLSPIEVADYKDRITRLMQEKNARLVAHYYTDSVLQDLAEETGGFVGDSLEMARFGHDCDAQILVVAGVRFMGEVQFPEVRFEYQLLFPVCFRISGVCPDPAFAPSTCARTLADLRSDPIHTGPCVLRLPDCH